MRNLRELWGFIENDELTEKERTVLEALMLGKDSNEIKNDILDMDFSLFNRIKDSLEKKLKNSVLSQPNRGATKGYIHFTITDIQAGIVLTLMGKKINNPIVKLRIGSAIKVKDGCHRINVYDLVIGLPLKRILQKSGFQKMGDFDGKTIKEVEFACISVGKESITEPQRRLLEKSLEPYAIKVVN